MRVSNEHSNVENSTGRRNIPHHTSFIDASNDQRKLCAVSESRVVVFFCYVSIIILPRLVIPTHSHRMEISVRQTCMKPKHIRSLLQNGIVLVSHLSTFDTARLAKKTRLSSDDCDEILSTIKPKKPHPIMQASELMLNPFPRIRTLIDGVDEILGGGIKCGQLTEFCGEAASGKSNLCAQIGSLIMLPTAFGGLDGDVLLIHTEGKGKLKLAIKRFETLSDSIDNLHVKNCVNDNELSEITNRLSKILDEKPAVKLVIVDSITCAFISEDEKPDATFYNRRSLRLTRIVKTLENLAWDRRIAIILTNHVTYSPSCGRNIPAMGKTWSHMCQTKIYLERDSRRRTARVTKGATRTPLPVHYILTNNSD